MMHKVSASGCGRTVMGLGGAGVVLEWSECVCASGDTPHVIPPFRFVYTWRAAGFFCSIAMHGCAEHVVSMSERAQWVVARKWDGVAAVPDHAQTAPARSLELVGLPVRSLRGTERVVHGLQHRMGPHERGNGRMGCVR